MAKRAKAGQAPGGEPMELVVFVCANSGQAGRVSGPVEQVAVKPVVMPCSSKTEAHVILKAFETGADGVMVVACPLGQCRFVEGNRRAEKRMVYVKGLLNEIGLDADRLRLFFADAGPVDKALASFAEAVANLGPTGIKRR